MALVVSALDDRLDAPDAPPPATCATSSRDADAASIRLVFWGSRAGGMADGSTDNGVRSSVMVSRLPEALVALRMRSVDGSAPGEDTTAAAMAGTTRLAASLIRSPGLRDLSS